WPWPWPLSFPSPPPLPLPLPFSSPPPLPWWCSFLHSLCRTCVWFLSPQPLPGLYCDFEALLSEWPFPPPASTPPVPAARMPTDRRTVTKRDRIIESFLAGGLVRCPPRARLPLVPALGEIRGSFLSPFSGDS